MFGIKYVHFDSMTYVFHYKSGKLKREGKGLSFFYFAPNSSISAIPLGSQDIQFIFNENTRDFQTVTIQGQLTYKIENPKQAVELLNFIISGKKEVSYEENFEVLDQRLTNEAQTSITAFIQGLNLKESIRGAKEIETKIHEGLPASEAVKLMGVKTLGVTVLGVKPTPEMAKALETETREALQKDADQAVYERRNFAVEQERKIKESELNTEIAVQEKKKQIQEKQAEIKVDEEENRRKLREMRIEADISVEGQRKELVEMKVQSDKKEADAQGYMLEKTLEPYKKMDWKSIMAINGGDNMNAGQHMAFAFREMAEKADKIGTLNITPDLLQSLLDEKPGHHTQGKQGKQGRGQR